MKHWFLILAIISCSTYASIPFEALNYENKKNLVGFGFAPEGIENNELLSDIAWRKEKVDVNKWLKDHPMHRYQFRPYKKPEGVENHATVDSSVEFGKAVESCLSCSTELKNSNLYTIDAIEMVVQYLGLVVDQQLLSFLDCSVRQTALGKCKKSKIKNIKKSTIYYEYY